MGDIIAISMHKGGVGKTSLISNLVGALVKKENKKILIVDTDGQGNLSTAFGLSAEPLEHTIYDVMVDDFPVEDVLLEIDENLHILPANSRMNFVEFDILPNLEHYTEPFNILNNILNKVKDNYDFIFIDTPPSMGLIQGNVLVASNKVIIPYVPEMYAVNGLIMIHKAIQQFSEDYNPHLEILGVVGMLVDSRTTLHQEMLQQARAYCHENNINMFGTVIPRSIRFASSTAEGKPATWLDKSNHLVHTYFNLLEELKDGGLV